VSFGEKIAYELVETEQGSFVLATELADKVLRVANLAAKSRKRFP